MTYKYAVEHCKKKRLEHFKWNSENPEAAVLVYLQDAVDVRLKYEMNTV
jgi:hypothetical protein